MPAKRQTVMTMTAMVVAMILVVLSRAGTAQGVTFTVVVIPDTQYETARRHEMLSSQVDWIAKNKSVKNISAAIQLGDITDDASQRQFITASSYLHRLNNVDGLVWGTCAGNHDLLDSPRGHHYDHYFGPSVFSGKPWYGESTASHSSYLIFAAGGRKYLVVNLEFEADADIRRWAQGVLDAHPGMPTIINTHAYIGAVKGGTGRIAYGETLWNDLVKSNPQIFIVLCGHATSAPAWFQTSINDAGLPVFEIMSNYQTYQEGGGYLRLMEFDEDNAVIRVKTYSPYFKKYLTKSAHQFDIPFDLARRFPPSSHRDRSGALGVVKSSERAMCLGTGKRHRGVGR